MTKAEILAKRIAPNKFYLPTLVRGQIYLMFDDYAGQEVLKATKDLQDKLDKANIESYNQAIEDVKARLGNWQNTGHFISEISTLKK